ncbi:hypothetical protein INT44_001461 [Umbelopsis vinacea]|uniref:UspA domain-containing protein n=1 Tax=Umbelopsis vinacea TaxID=44442 RepID=A0A8H7UAF5_9FUNG|nr:hypothetical protein INT44_001461 [Umbelopsis vinacea]KAI9279500.1 hypothetical protein BC943DRAFT_311653 [Umbelopsis sp. AD052]
MSYLGVKSDKYVRGVSFDNMTDKDLPDYSFTLRGKSKGFQRTRRSRTFMVATDLANYSEYALTWANEEIMDSGDELIILRVVTVDMTDKRANVQALLHHEEVKARENANAVLNKVLDKETDIEISVVIEFVIGKVQETIQHMIAMYQPSMLIVGTRGLSDFKTMLLGSISKYCLQHSPVPVVVVRPDDKLKKMKKNKNRLSNLMRIGGKSGTTSEEDFSASNNGSPGLEKGMSKLSVDGYFSRSRTPSPATSPQPSPTTSTVPSSK